MVSPRPVEVSDIGGLESRTIWEVMEGINRGGVRMCMTGFTSRTKCGIAIMNMRVKSVSSYGAESGPALWHLKEMSRCR